MREPWFRIIEVREPSGRSIADIAKQAANEFGMRLSDMRDRRYPSARSARRRALQMIRTERRDLSSSQVAAFFGMEGSTVRHVWRRFEAESRHA